MKVDCCKCHVSGNSSTKAKTYLNELAFTIAQLLHPKSSLHSRHIYDTGCIVVLPRSVVLIAPKTSYYPYARAFRINTI